MLFVDTDILIDVSRNLTEAVDFVQRAERDSDVAISAMTQMELLVGARNKIELYSIEKFITRFAVVKLNETIADKRKEPTT